MNLACDFSEVPIGQVATCTRCGQAIRYRGRPIMAICRALVPSGAPIKTPLVCALDAHCAKWYTPAVLEQALARLAICRGNPCGQFGRDRCAEVHHAMQPCGDRRRFVVRLCTGDCPHWPADLRPAPVL